MLKSKHIHHELLGDDMSYKWGGQGASESPASHTMFSHLLYFCAPLPPDSHPSLCCFRLQVNQEDQ